MAETKVTTIEEDRVVVLSDPNGWRCYLPQHIALEVATSPELQRQILEAASRMPIEYHLVGATEHP
jgi:hypothetical protein